MQNFIHEFLARNASVANLGAPRACQRVALSVAMAKNQSLWAHAWAKNGPKTAETWAIENSRYTNHGGFIVIGGGGGENDHAVGRKSTLVPVWFIIFTG